MINEDETACIPIPGSPVPFPFMCMTLCILLIAIGSKLKDKQTTKLSTNLVFLIGNMELIEYGLLTLFAY